jgi:hypothetical protein
MHKDVIAMKRQKDEEALREAERLRAEEHAREEEECQKAAEARKQQTFAEAQRLRGAGFVLEAELDGRPLWRHDAHGAHFWHSEAVALLNAAEREAMVDKDELPPAA